MIAIGVDVAVVTVFVAIGRRNHDGTSAVRDIVDTGAPFLIGLAAAWAVVAAWKRPIAIRTGVAIWPVTVVIGMIARRVLFDRGTAVSFVIVATTFLGLCFVGWRVAFRVVTARRQLSRLTP